MIWEFYFGLVSKYSAMACMGTHNWARTDNRYHYELFPFYQYAILTKSKFDQPFVLLDNFSLSSTKQYCGDAWLTTNELAALRAQHHGGKLSRCDVTCNTDKNGAKIFLTETFCGIFASI